jgi:hypothetical protein
MTDVLAPSQALNMVASHSTISQRFSPQSVQGAYTRVSLDCTGRRVRFSGAGYYFGHNKAINKWDLEDDLYRRFAFRLIMLVLLLASFAGMTILALYL